jgi:PAS domain S-box-containing protein
MNAPKLASFNLYIPPESLKATLILALLSVWVLVGFFFYLNRYTRRTYFTLWTIAWLFYALWLSMTLVFQVAQNESILIIWKQWSLGVTAVFLLWGSLRFVGKRIKRSIFAWSTIFLLIWSVAGGLLARYRLFFELPLFAMTTAASLFTAHCFYRYRRDRGFHGATLLTVGFVLWAFFQASYPFLQIYREVGTVAFFIATVLQLFIAISMIILVLEEVRNTNQLAFQRIRVQQNEKAVLKTKVASTEERYRSLFDQASEGIIITHAQDMRILELNSTAERLLGISRSESNSQVLSHFCQSSLSPAFDDKKGTDWFNWICEQRQITLISKDGAATPVEVDGAAIDFEGIKAHQFFFRELTERSRLEQQLRQAEKLSALGQMISGVAHELNNPLAVIKGYLELILAHHDLPPQTKADLEKVAKESNRASKLVRNFLTFGREQQAHREMVNMNELIQRITELRKFDILIAGVDLSLELAPTPPQTEADPDQIQQLVNNLLTNALQAMVESPQPRKLQIRTQLSSDILKISVEDNGPGVPPELETKIFEPFFTTKEVGTGTGLGLSIAHGIMADHHGRIFYQQSSMGGAGFVLEFPLVANAAQSVPIQQAGQDVIVSLHNSQIIPAQILVLDDEKGIAELLCEMLSVIGHQPTLCLSSPQALDLIQQRHFDAILSDYRMPVMNGQEFYNALMTKNPDLAQRIIFLTGDVMNLETQTFLDSIHNPHISKPFQLTHIQTVLNEVLSKRDSQASQPALKG